MRLLSSAVNVNTARVHVRGRLSGAPIQQRDHSPFVAMTLAHRLVLIGGSFVVLALVGVLHLLSGNQTASYFSLFLALCLRVSLGLIPIVWYRSSMGWVHPLVFDFVCFLISAARQVAIYSQGLSSNQALSHLDAEALTGLVAYSLLLSSLAWMAYFVGYVSTPVRRQPTGNLVTFITPQGLRVKVIVTVCVAVAIFVLNVLSHGGVSELFTTLGMGRSAAIGEGRLAWHWVYLTSFGAYACLIWFTLDSRTLRMSIFWLLMFGSTVLVFLTSASRSVIFIYSAYMALVWALQRGKVIAVRLMLLAFLALPIMSVLGAVRSSTWSGDVDWSQATKFGLSEAVENALAESAVRTSERTAVYAVFEKVPYDVPLLYGSSYFPVLTSFVPRALWPLKPQGIDTLAGLTFMDLRAGAPIGPIAEAYWNFHIPGVVIVFLMFGAFHNWLVQTYKRYLHQPAAALLYAIALFTVSPSSLSITTALQTIAAVLTLFWLFGIMRRTPTTPRSQRSRRVA